MGVITTAAVPEGKTFGPIPANLTITDPTLLIGHMTSDSRPDVHTVKINILDYAGGARLAEWVPYVQAARDEREQNVEALIQGGQLYYRLLRSVSALGELTVWYSEDLAQVLGVPQLNEVHYNDNGTYCCPYCAQNFRFPYSLRAHLRFKCDTLRKAMHMDTPALRPPVSLGAGSPFMFPPMASRARTEHSPNGSVTSATSSTESTSPPRYNHSPDGAPRYNHSPDGAPRYNHSPDGAPRYNHSPDGASDSDPQPPARKRTYSDSGSESATDNTHGSSSPKLKRVSLDSDEHETRSAFRKVERHSAQENGHSPSVGVPKSSPSPYSRPPEDKGLDTTKPLILPGTTPLGGGPHLAGRFPLSMSNSFLSQITANRMHIDNHPAHLAADQNPHNINKLMDIRNVENNNVYNKMAVFPGDRRFGLYPPLFKSNNPMVDKLLVTNAPPVQTTLTSFSMAQNWCAKCNTTFRMTSDLVYHMRSHHKREFDPLKRKREEKLRCDVCGETFKERHHLSRHMTSHA